MRFVHRTVYWVQGISSLAADPTLVVEGVALGALDVDQRDWLHRLGLEALRVSVSLRGDESCFAEIDLRDAIANQSLNALFGNAELNGLPADELASVRAARTKVASGPWLVIDIDGEHRDAHLTLGDVDPRWGVSIERVHKPTVLRELSSDATLGLHHLCKAVLRVGTGLALQFSSAGQSSWYCRPDGHQHMLFGLQVNAKGFASRPLNDDARTQCAGLVAAAGASPRLAQSLRAYGQSLDVDLDAHLAFLSAFSALELLTKHRAGRAPYQRPETRRGLRADFDTIAEGNDDVERFERLYDLRNDFAHEARFTADAAHIARELYEKYLPSTP